MRDGDLARKKRRSVTSDLVVRLAADLSVGECATRALVGLSSRAAGSSSVGLIGLTSRYRGRRPPWRCPP